MSENIKGANIDCVIEYSLTMVGVPYRWHRGGDSIEQDDKFWAKNDSSVTREEIDRKDKCIVCTGLINLMRRHLKLSIPGINTGPKWWRDFPGTTGTWFEYLDEKERLKPIDLSKKYPKGTLLLRNFESVEKDQGHVAVLLEKRNILHAYSNFTYAESFYMKNVGQTGIQRLEEVHFGWNKKGYFTHICLPENWLLVD